MTLLDASIREEGPTSLRPKAFADFIGQEAICRNLKIFIQSAKTRQQPLDHVLLHGPPGLGKTTLAQIIAQERCSEFKATSGPVILKSGDLAAILTNLQQHDVLFIDEIHRLHPAIEEILYTAMEDFKLDILIGEGPSARSIRIDLPPFTLVGATTRSGLLTQPLRERFGIPLKLEFYDLSDLAVIITRASEKLNLPIESDAAHEIAKRSRGTPRIAQRILKRIRDFCIVGGHAKIAKNNTMYALEQLNVDPKGLDCSDLKYLQAIAEFYNGGPVGLETLSAVLSEQKDTIEDVIEPYLVQQGFIKKTSRGRILTEIGYKHLNIPIEKQMGFEDV